VVDQFAIVDRDAPITGATASAWIANRIAVRYANPARRAYLFLFQLQPGTAFMPIPPDPAHVVSSWFDEGGGLARSPIETAIERCRVLNTALHAYDPIPKGKFVTRQMMARIVVFSVTLVAAEADPTMSIDLFSRALAFTPKADRRVTELWKTGGEGWYSTYTGDDD
jgi:hypothetical protein